MPNKKKHLLLAEDEEAMSRILATTLASDNCQVHVASDGAEAITLIRENHYDLILLDLVMPHVDGFGVLAEINKQKDAPPVLVLTNLTQPENRRRAKQLGATKYMIKLDSPLPKIRTTVESMI